MNVLEFSNVHRAYDRGVDVLHGVSFAVGRGEVVGLLGKNGAGKTTLIRIAMGMLSTGEGSVSVFGVDPRVEPVAVKSRIGYVSEDQVLPPFLTVREIVSIHRGLFPTWDDPMAEDLLQGFSLDAGAKIGKLSKGQARQVALLCAVAHRPELLLLDEPAGGLDPAARREFLETSIRLLNEAGSTILFSSHYMTDVERMAERVVMVHEGELLIDKSLDDLREHHCVALVPRENGASAEKLRTIEGCLGVRERSDALHAVFALAPDGAIPLIQTGLGVDGVNCRSVGLEEMFIELAGGQS